MGHTILMPKPGQMTEECVLVAWLKAEGDQVRKGDVLFEIETDKSVMEVEAFEDGVLLRRYVEAGQTVPVNSVCGYMGTIDEAPPVEVPLTAASPTLPESSLAAEPAPDAAPPLASNEPASADRVLSRRGSGQEPGGPRISPRASRLAADRGIDPRSVAGTGPLGRITEADIRAVLAKGTTADDAPRVDGLDEEARPLSRMRRVIAQRLTESFTTTPHFTLTMAIDVGRLLELRRRLRADGDELSVTDFILSAVAQSLVEFPEVNSRTDGTTMWLRRRVHIGLAVSVPGGLVVPVVRDADRLTVWELHDRASALVEAARDGTLAVDAMNGSTFTVSNLGMFGVEEFTAIINPGEAAILAVSSIRPTPVAIADGLAVRQMMRVTLSADHRLIDGELAARFLNAVRRRLEDGAELGDLSAGR